MTNFRHFSSVEGHVVPRWGTDTFIGVTRAPGGWKWNTGKMVKIPADECRRYLREYNRALKDGSLKEHKDAPEKVEDTDAGNIDTETTVTPQPAKTTKTKTKKKSDEGK